MSWRNQTYQCCERNPIPAGPDGREEGEEEEDGEEGEDEGEEEEEEEDCEKARARKRF